jgi:site-specific recombinase XerD
MRPQKARASVAEAKERFFRDLRATGRSERTLVHYNEAIDQFYAHYFGEDPFRDPRKVTPAHVQAFLIALRRLKRKDATVQARYRALHRFFGWQVKHRFLAVSPLKEVTKPQVRPQAVIPYTHEEVLKMIEATRRWNGSALRDQVIICLLYNTGMRAGELCTLRPKDIHAGRILVTGKGKKQRWLALDDVTETRLRQYMAQPTALDRSLFGLSVSGLQQLVRRLAVAACVPGAYVHRFRDTYAVRFLENGGGVDDLQVQLGHSNIETTLRYVMYGREQRALDAQRKHAPFARLATTAT